MTRIPDGSTLMQAAVAERRRLISHMFSELEQPRRELSQWELSFLASTRDAFENTYRLTDRQFETLERIYKSKTE